MHQLKQALVDVDYPAPKDALLAAADRHGADEQVLAALRALPVDDYASFDNVVASVDTEQD